MTKEREELRRIEKAVNVFNIWLKGQRTYVSREDAEHAYRTAIKYLNKGRAELSSIIANDNATRKESSLESKDKR